MSLPAAIRSGPVSFGILALALLAAACDAPIQNTGGRRTPALPVFGQQKVVILGYSYGSSIGPRLVEQHPDRFHAYVGLGQSGGPGSEAQLYSTLMGRVREGDDTGAIRELEALQPYPPPRGPGAVAKLLAARKWARLATESVDHYSAYPFSSVLLAQRIHQSSHTSGIRDSSDIGSYMVTRRVDLTASECTIRSGTRDGKNHPD